MAFTLAPPLTRSDLAVLIRATSQADGETQNFALPARAPLDDEVEHGFLSLQNSGIFGKDMDAPVWESEFFITEDGALSVDGWSDCWITGK
ncbi:hypothetical protein SAMN04487972_102282 [Paracoccus halophilus]|uniref:Uncharacterized protein n=1 Tax=Paracoccus halophilus TaxID=376733 RepID=A0A099F9B0_9RHOB|nr:hypothetical protein [Paracoccus halophilus]KGJ06672.1 hypothetical protein IT41_00375 [Paracoccus halophilus]SFA42295.1 hypothetical protein SAMN04487972_102282 [Paracoccus halophilus]